MNKRISLIIFLLFCGISLQAQNPGYQGRKFSLNYNLYTFNSVYSLNETGHKGILSFNTLHHLEWDMTVGRKTTLGFAGEYLHTSFEFDRPFTYSLPTSHGSTPIFFNSNSTGKIEAWGVGLYTKFFFGGNIAPLGGYIKPQITLLIYNIYPGAPTLNYGEEDPFPYFKNESPYLTPAISLEIGNNHIFFNRMFLDYGLRVGLLPFMLGHMDSQLDITNYLNELAMERISRHYLVNVKVGVGVLLF